MIVGYIAIGLFSTVLLVSNIVRFVILWKEHKKKN